MEEKKKKTAVKKKTSKKATTKSSQPKKNIKKQTVKKKVNKTVKKSSKKVGDDIVINNNENLSSVQVKKKIRIKRNYLVLIIALFFIVVFALVLSASYGFFTTQTNSKNYVMYVGNLQVDFEPNGNVININNAVPMTNTQGQSQQGYTFKVANNGTVEAKYQVRLEVESDVNTTNNKVEYIPLEYIKMTYSIDGTNYSEPVKLSDLDDNLVIANNQIIAAGTKDNYTLKLWVDYSAPTEMSGKVFKAKIVIDAIQVSDTNGIIADAAPVIKLKKDASGNIDLNYVVDNNATYTDLGVESVNDDLDKLDKSNVTLTYEYFDGTTITDAQGVDLSTSGVYFITYQITDSGSNTGKAVRVVKVNPTETIPTISLTGASSLSIEQFNTYTEPGVTVQNNNKVVTIGEVKTSTPGVYPIKYIVIDSKNNMNSVTRTVTVTKATEYLLSNKILADNPTIKTNPTLNNTSAATNENGLYSMSVTNGFGGGTGTTYFFRGDVNNNIVEFAGLTWRIVRINEDGTIRLILDSSIDTTTYAFNSNSSTYDKMYYSNSQIKNTMENWYQTNIGNNSGLDSMVVAGNYLCEAARSTYSGSYTSGNATMTLYSSYTPDLSCTTDGNGKGLINSNIGLITYDEVVLAGGYYGKANQSYYLYKTASNGENNYTYWTMSPAGFSGSTAHAWYSGSTGYPSSYNNGTNAFRLRPVINLKADTVVTKRPTGDSNYPYKYVVENNPPTPGSFATDSWTTIVANVRAGNGDVYAPTANGVNNQVLREVNLGSLGTHYLRVANTTPCTNGETSQTACGFVVEFADIITTHNMNSSATNVGGYPASEMFTYINDTVLPAMPQEIRNVMIPTTVVSSYGSSDSNNFTTPNQYLYLLDQQEVFGDNNSYNTAASATRQLDYYSLNNSNDNRIKKNSGTAAYWWLRSAYFYNNSDFSRVYGGGSNYGNYSYAAYGVSPAFRIG